MNVSQLLTDSVFLGSENVAAGTYTGLSLTFANPELTIFNNSAAMIRAGANTCANNTVCQLSPPTGPLTLTFYSFAALPCHLVGELAPSL